MRPAIAVLAFCVFVPNALAQYTVNWPTQPATPMATGMGTGTQTLKVSGVNDFLYSYDINLTEVETPTQVGQFPVAPGGIAAPAPSCADKDVGTLDGDVTTANTALLNLSKDAATSPKSLLTTQTAWKTSVGPAYGKIAQEITTAQAAVNSMADPAKTECQKVITSDTTIYSTLKTADTKLNTGAHTIGATFQANSCKSEILTIVEKYNGTPTGQSVTVRLDAQCDEVTVGGGVLMTEIQNRTYASSPLPNQTGQFLSVGGTGKFTPTLIVLTSFNFPVEPLGHKVSSALGNWRLGISTGPVLQPGATTTSSFGWFAGGTLSFFHRLYITPGIHFGQFANFPLGFNSGQQIPANYGQLTPVKQWTGRFGIAITIKGWDASKTLTGGQDQPTTTKKPT